MALTLRCVVLGAGGHARVLLDCLLSAGEVEVVGLLDANRSLWGGKLDGVSILGGFEYLPGLASQGITRFVVGVGGIGDNSVRAGFFQLGRAAGLSPLTVIHHSAICAQNAVLGSGAQVLARAVVNVGARLGNNVLINTAAVVEHDCVVEDHAHLATNAALAGEVQIGKLAHVGVGAVVKQRVRVGERAVVGAGAVVVKDVAPGTVVVGVPARLLIGGKFSASRAQL